MSILKEIDHGTPAITSSMTVSAKINGMDISVPEGTSIMRAASLYGIDIPKLCASDSLESFGSCRLCIVDYKDRTGFGYPSSCTTPITEGMEVITHNEKLIYLRKNLMELYISDHPLDCNTCAADGDCKLQDQASDLDLLGTNNMLKPTRTTRLPTTLIWANQLILPIHILTLIQKNASFVHVASGHVMKFKVLMLCHFMGGVMTLRLSLALQKIF